MDLYNKIKSEPNDIDETQCDWKGAPPIPYKVAKALAPDYYRNIELDIWCELKRGTYDRSLYKTLNYLQFSTS